MTVPQDLIERVRKATGPDRELDALIEVEARRLEAYRAGLNDEQRANWKAGKSGVVTDGHTTYYPYVFTASIDAALALAERVLPGWWLHGLGKSPLHGLWWCQLYSLDEKRASEADEVNTAPLAIVLAVLTALQSSEQSK